jgi:hypothetical protein
MPVRTIVLFAKFPCGLAHADFKYMQSGQFTNSVAEAKAAFGTQITQVTIYVKGEFLRLDLPDGLYGIIDLDRRRMNSSAVSSDYASMRTLWPASMPTLRGSDRFVDNIRSR